MPRKKSPGLLSSVPKLREADILKAILSYLTYQNVFHFRVPVSPILRNGTGRGAAFSPSPLRGCPDVLSVLPGGRLCAIEVKRPGEKLSDVQAQWRDRLIGAGVVYVLATSVEDVARIFAA